MPSTQHPQYQGRPLVRPDDEVVDQGLGFDVVTLLDRRQMLRAFGLGATALGLAACGAGTSGSATSAAPASTSAAGSTATTSIVEIPDETAGPYPGDGSNGVDVLEQSGIVRSDLRTSFGDADATAEGVAMNLELTILDIANGGIPFAGVAVYVWHCNRSGEYSLYSTGIENENYLRGVQITDAAGTVRFTSIFPACYTGRWPHIHFEVYPDQAGIADSTNAISTSQIALPQDVSELVYAQTGYEASVGNLAQVSLTTDNVFSDDGGVHQIAAVTGDVTAGFTVSLVAGVDTTTAPTAGSAPAGGPGGGPGGQPPSGGAPGGQPPAGAAPSGAPAQGSTA